LIKGNISQLNELMRSNNEQQPINLRSCECFKSKVVSFNIG